MIRLAVRVARADAEAVLAELLEIAPGRGVEEVEAGDAVEYVLYGAPGELPDLPDVRAAARDALVEVSSSEVADDWAERWKAFHQPIEVGPVRVRPPWEAARARSGEIDVVIDPGQAFGTGAHWTTRLSLDLLLGFARPDFADARPLGDVTSPFSDWGTGSGVLAVVAAKLGFAPVLAVDFDPLSVEAARANAQANRVAVEVAQVDLRGQEGPWAPVVCANLLRPLLLEVAARMTRPPELLVLSGLLAEEADEIVAAFAPHGLREAERRHGGEWAALALVPSG